MATGKEDGAFGKGGYTVVPLDRGGRASSSRLVMYNMLHLAISWLSFADKGDFKRSLCRHYNSTSIPSLSNSIMKRDSWNDRRTDGRTDSLMKMRGHML